MKTITKLISLIMLCGIFAGCITINVIVTPDEDTNSSKRKPSTTNSSEVNYTRPTTSTTVGTSSEDYARPTTPPTYTRPTTSTTVGTSSEDYIRPTTPPTYTRPNLPPMLTDTTRTNSRVRR